MMPHKNQITSIAYEKKIKFTVTSKLTCHVNESGSCDTSCSTKCHVTCSAMATQSLQDNTIRLYENN